MQLYGGYAGLGGKAGHEAGLFCNEAGQAGLHAVRRIVLRTRPCRFYKSREQFVAGREKYAVAEKAWRNGQKTE